MSELIGCKHPILARKKRVDGTFGMIHLKELASCGTLKN